MMRFEKTGEQRKRRTRYVSMGVSFLAFCYFLFGMLTSCSDSGATKAVVKPVFPALKNSVLYLQTIEEKGLRSIDSIAVKDGVSFVVSLDAPDYYVVGNKEDKIFLILRPGDTLTLTSGRKHFKDDYEVQGSEDSRFLRDFIIYVRNEDHMRDSLVKLRDTSEGNPAYYDIKSRIDSSLQRLFEKRREYVENQIVTYPYSLANLIIINKKFGLKRVLDEQDDFHYYHRLDTALFARYPDNRWVKDFHEKVRKLRLQRFDEYNEDQRLQPGKMAPNIVLWDTLDRRHSVKHYAYHRQAVLLYFWASWDEKSIHFNEKLKARYHSLFEANNIPIMAVSLDESKKVWKLTLRRQDLPWLNVSDLQGLDSEVMKAYNLSRKRIPQFYFVDDRRRIVFRSQDIDSTLSKIENWIIKKETHAAK